MSSNKEILVFADWDGLETPQFIGSLFSSYSRGKEIFSFEYDKEWLQSSFVQEIDPDLGLYSGIQCRHGHPFVNSNRQVINWRMI